MKVLKGFLIFLVIVLSIIVIIVSCSDTEEELAAKPEEVVEEREEEIDEIEGYYDNIYWNTRFIGDEFIWFGEHFNEYDGSDQWYDEAELGILEILFWIEDAEENINPPAEMQEHYDLYMEALNKYRNGMNILLKALETGLDEATLDEAMEYFDQGTAIIEEIGVMVIQ